MPTNVSNTPCPIPRCPRDRYPHLPLCWDHWRQLPAGLRQTYEYAAQQDHTGPGHLAAFRQTVDYYSVDR